MAKSPLFGRRIHIAGSVSGNSTIASPADAENARTFVQGLVRELVRRGATFVLPVDAEKQPTGRWPADLLRLADVADASRSPRLSACECS
jgi:hypothetical protein